MRQARVAARSLGVKLQSLEVEEDPNSSTVPSPPSSRGRAGRARPAEPGTYACTIASACVIEFASTTRRSCRVAGGGAVAGNLLRRAA